MLLVDAIVEETETTIVCKKTFLEDEYFFQGHFPGSPIVPGVIQCECCLQAGALLLAGRSSQQPDESSSADSSSATSSSATLSLGELPVATRMDSVKFKRMISPGDAVEMHITLKEQVSNAFYLTGKMMLAGKLAMRLDFSVAMSPAPGQDSQS